VRKYGLCGLCLLFIMTLVCFAIAEEDPGLPLSVNWDFYEHAWLPDLPKATPEEPRMRHFDERKAAQFLDHYALEWTEHNHCGTCHTNVVALIVRPMIPRVRNRQVTLEIRTRLLNYADESRAKPRESTVALMIPAAAAVAINEVSSGEALDPRVEELLDYIWAHQSEDGSWNYPARAFLLPFLERDRTYIAMLAALTASYIPDYFERRPMSQEHLEKLKRFLRERPSQSLHHQAVLLWISSRLSGLLGSEQQTKIASELLERQNSDGGWTLAALGTWPRHDGAANDPLGPSDGYATGLATLALCKTDGKAREPIRRSLAWLRTNQRESGRWYTRSLYSDGFKNYLSNMGTAYAVMAIKQCDQNLQ
jgi:squalene-hopene/tetraprenyl-beta-curcumene cyclase